MDVTELYLYAGFAVGWLVRRWRPSRSPWTSRATFGAVVALLGLLGASFRTVPPAGLLSALPVSIAFAGGLIATTAAAFVVARWVKGPGDARQAAAPSQPSRERVPTSAVLLVALLLGYAGGRQVALPTAPLLTIALVVLLGLIGYSIELTATSARRAWLPVLCAIAGAVVAAAGFALAGGTPWTAALATALGFGWYSLTGPLVAARLGASLGLLAFLTNFVREALTMLLAPHLGRRLRGDGLAALGGATAMDTTLYFVVRYGDESAGALAVASGLTLTVAAGLVVPLVLAL